MEKYGGFKNLVFIEVFPKHLQFLSQLVLWKIGNGTLPFLCLPPVGHSCSLHCNSLEKALLTPFYRLENCGS